MLLRLQRLDPEFLDRYAGDENLVALLPGSRTQEVTRNLPTLIRAAARIHRERPSARTR